MKKLRTIFAILVALSLIVVGCSSKNAKNDTKSDGKSGYKIGVVTGIAVDALEERLDWLGWTNGDGYGVDGVYAANRLATASCDVHLDALIIGLSFVAVIPNGDG